MEQSVPLFRVREKAQDKIRTGLRRIPASKGDYNPLGVAFRVLLGHIMRMGLVSGT